MSIIECAKGIGIQHNVSMRVRDAITGKVVQRHDGHNAATNSLLTGIAHYLTGDGVLNQGHHMLNAYVPKYISLGTMGLVDQSQDENGLPSGIGAIRYTDITYDELSDADLALIGKYRDVNRNILPSGDKNDRVSTADDEILRYADYMRQIPGYGADGYDSTLNNNREYFGLGPKYAGASINCELISDSFPRAQISFRDIVPEVEAEYPKTIDIVFSAMVSTGALAQFRDKDTGYIFITEAGLWSRPDWVDGGDNGLLAGYRITPSSRNNWDMQDARNRNILKQSILKVGTNQVVQVIWKIQIGSIDYLANI